MKNYVMALVMILMATGAVFGQAETSTFVAPYFKGSGGFVGESATMDNMDTMDVDEGAVTFVVTCGNVTTTGEAARDEKGIVRQYFGEDNGLACGEADGKIEISNLKPGGWYYINDEVNSAVSSLVNKNVLDNDHVMPTDPGGVTIDKMGEHGAASYIKHEPSGRVGIIPHIQPTPPMATCSPASQNNCVVRASYSIKLVTGAGTTEKPVGATLTRDAMETLTVTPSVDATGNLADGMGDTFMTKISGTDGVKLHGVGVNNDGSVTIEAQSGAGDRCGPKNIDRGTAITVTVEHDEAGTGWIPAPGDLADRSFMVVCPPVPAASSQGVDLVPENPFPTDR